MSNKKTDDSVIHVVIVGRPNVGKSTLFNRLVKKRKAVTDMHSGTTRDRVYERLVIDDKEVFIVDTGGIQYAAKESDIDFLVDREVTKAIVAADLILFVCDVTGLTATDYQLADDLRRKNKEVIVVVNKADVRDQSLSQRDVLRLGLGEPCYISAIHGGNMDELITLLYKRLPKVCCIPQSRATFRMAIIGEPNAGKSTLMNQLIQEERAVVSPVAGTTRDAIEVDFVHGDTVVRIIDTAGIKKKKKMNTTAALFSWFRTEETIKNSDVIVLLIDAQRGPQQDTRNIYNMIRQENKACLIAVNKWDMVHGLPMEDYKKRLVKECGFMEVTPLYFISAKTGRNVHSLLDYAISAWESYTQSIPTKELNTFLEKVKRRNPPPPTIRLKYMTQAGVKPPSFIFFVKNKKNLPKHYMTFFTHEFCEYFRLKGTLPRFILKEEVKDKE